MSTIILANYNYNDVFQLNFILTDVCFLFKVGQCFKINKLSK